MTVASYSSFRAAPHSEQNLLVSELLAVQDGQANMSCVF
jgi:hypothetical protein